MIAAAVVPIGLPDCASRGAASCVARRPLPMRSGSVGSGCSDKIAWTMMIWLWLNNVFWCGSSSRVGCRQGSVCSRRVNSTLGSQARLVRVYRIVCQMKYDTCSRNCCHRALSYTAAVWTIGMPITLVSPTVVSTGQQRPLV